MLPTAILHMAAGAHTVAQLVAALIKALILTALIALGILVAIAIWPVIQPILIAASLIALYCWATYPRPARKGVRK